MVRLVVVMMVMVMMWVHVVVNVVMMVEVVMVVMDVVDGDEALNLPMVALKPGAKHRARRSSAMGGDNQMSGDGGGVGTGSSASSAFVSSAEGTGSTTGTPEGSVGARSESAIYPGDKAFNGTTGKVCILTRHLNLIQETIRVPIDKELVPVRAYEIEGEIDSLFNGCILYSSSDEDDPTYTWNGAKELTTDNDEDLEEQDEEWWHNVGTDILASTQSTQPRKGLPHALGTRSKTKQNTFLVGNQIGFKMNGKECDVARILDDGDHNSLWSNSLFDIAFKKAMGKSGGDFNKVRAESERMGIVFDPRGARFFNNFIESSGLHDIQMGGKWFTRMNNIGSKLSKLDRILVSCHFLDRWTNSYILPLTREFSDHTPLLLSNSVHDYGPTPFKFFNSWLSHKDFALLVERCWLLPTNETITSSPVIFKIKLQHLKKIIKQWRCEIHCNESETTKELRCIDQLDSLAELGPLSSAHIIARTEAVRDLTALEYRKLNDLKQKSRPFTSSKIKDAIWDCEGEKAPGPDGFTFKFIKKYWYLLESDIISYVKHFELSGHTPRGCNSSFITLVLKLEDPIVLTIEALNIVLLEATNNNIFHGVKVGLPVGAKMSRCLNWSPLVERAPKKTINKLEKIHRKFFWGGNLDENKISWIAWKKVISPINHGGLDIGSLKSSSQAMLSKWWWRFRTDGNAL
ncbi:cytochrome P450, partial [Tanacetum coccineum]